MVRSPRRDHGRAFLSSLLPLTALQPLSSSATRQVRDLGQSSPPQRCPAESARPFEPSACRSRGEMGRSAAALALPAARAFEPLRSGPDQAVAGPLLVRDQVGEDWSGEARIIEPDLVVAPAALLGRLGPGGPELDAVRKEAEGGRAVVVGVDGLQGDLGEVEGQRLDLALEEAVFRRGEGADGGHGVSPVRFVSGPPFATLMVIDTAGGASARILKGPEQRGGWRRPTVLVREECAAEVPAARGGREGEKSWGEPLPGRREASADPRPDHVHQDARGRANYDPSTG